MAYSFGSLIVGNTIYLPPLYLVGDKSVIILLSSFWPTRVAFFSCQFLK